MAVKKGLKGLLNQGSQEMLAAMQRDQQDEADRATGRGVGPTLPVAAPAGPSSAVATAVKEPLAARPAAPAVPQPVEPAHEPAPRAQQEPVPAAPKQAAPQPEKSAGERTTAAEPKAAKKPSWEEMDRKEVRVYGDQVLALTTLRMKINKGKKGPERITDNTLIRTAIDLLLQHQDELGGVTENEIRASCGLDPRY
ncbi:hypothetical protein [Arthrobacter echini]|uniref:hypothetical protein n=1 Tax=Arthrobacter echini TaxID=1529066 RepID=UPI001B3B5749|nr:hypothetical protein [Arthrobacter echini]